MAYTDQAAALVALKGLNAVRDLPLPADDAFLNELLLASSARVGGEGGYEGEVFYAPNTLVYRHYYVAGRFLEILRSQQALKEAKGVKFTNLATPIASLMRMQQGMDAALDLQVPTGHEAVMASVKVSARATQGVLIGSSSRNTTLLP